MVRAGELICSQDCFFASNLLYSPTKPHTNPVGCNEDNSYSMGKSLVIVESPAKAKTINKYLGNQYVVKSSIGHIRDLPTSGSASAAKEPVKRGKAAAGEAPAL